MADGGDSSPPIKLSPSASRTSLGSDASAKTLRKASFLGPDDNHAANAFTLRNFTLQDRLETKIKNEIKSTKSISLEHTHKAEDNHEKNKELFPDGETRLRDITEGKSLQQKVAKEAKVVTKGIRGGADKRVLLPAVLELQGEVRTSLQLFLTMTFFFVFTVAVQQHYRTYEIHLQEKNLRNQLTDPTQDISEVGQIFEWMESTWFPFLWSAPNAAGPPDSILPSREVILLGGSLLKVISSPVEECIYVPGAECYDQGERAINYDPVLNGWDVSNRRLTSSDEQSRDQGGPNFLMRLYQSTRPWLEIPSTSSSWRKVLPQAPAGPEEPPKRPRTGRVKSRSRAPPKPRRRLQGGLEVLPRDRKRSSRFGFRRDEPEKRRRLVATSSVIMDGLPMPVGDEKAAVKVIPMSRSATDVVAQLGTWQSETNQLLTMRSLIFSAETVVINRQTRITTHIIVNFLLSRGGEVFTQVRLRSLHMDNSFVAIIFGGLWVLLLFGALFVLVGRIVIAFSNGKASVHFSNLSTYVQWSIVAIGLVVVILMCMERWEMLRARALLDDYLEIRPDVSAVELQDFDISWFTKLHTVIYWASKADGDLVILISLFHILLLFQFLVASKGQPRLALLANTLEMAFQDILHLFVVFFFIFSAFVIAGHILFGSKLRDFSTVKGAFAKSLEQVVSFKTDWDVITEQDWWTAAIWIWCMIIVVSLVVINIVLAVIFDCYGKIRAGITDEDTLWTTIRRHFAALRNMSKWYSSFDLLTGIQNTKMEVITKQGFREIFRGITDEQVEQIFDLAELRAVNDTIRGQPTLLGEAIASILLGVDDMRDGIRTIQDKQFRSYKEAKIWMEELEEPLRAPDTLWDLGPATYIVTCPYGCDVRAKPDVNSELITRLAKGDKVEVVRTQDYVAGEGLRRLMGEMQDNAGYLPLFDPDTGYVWAETWEDPSKAEPDFPGTYHILHDGAHLRQDISLSSPLVTEFTAGQMVNVVEVVLDYFDEDQYASRKRARVENPAGWISLVDRDSGYRFAERLANPVPSGMYVMKADAAAVTEPGGTEVVSHLHVADSVQVVNFKQVDGQVWAQSVVGGWLVLADAEYRPDLPIATSPEEAKMPRDAPKWVADGLLCHLQRQHRNMLRITEHFQDIQQGFEKLGLELEPVLEIAEPEAPMFDQMLQPARFAQSNPDRVAVRREKPAVNLPRPSATMTSQALKSRLNHFLTSI